MRECARIIALAEKGVGENAEFEEVNSGEEAISFGVRALVHAEGIGWVRIGTG